MNIKTKAKKITAIIGLCCVFVVARPIPASAFVWPVTDIAEIGSFVNSISSGLQQISNTKNQFQNYVNTIKAIGDQVQSIKKYAADLKATISNIKESVSQLATSIKDTVQSATDAVSSVKGAVKKSEEIVQETASVAVDGVESQVDNGATEEEIHAILEEAENGTEEVKTNLMELLDETQNVVDQAITETKENLNRMADILNSHEGLSDEEYRNINEETDRILKKVDALKDKMDKVLEKIKSDCETQYNEVVVKAFDEYNQAVSDYYAGKISREELSAAGEVFKSKIAEFKIDIDETALTELAEEARQIVEESKQLEEKILNFVGNDKDYSYLNKTHYTFAFNKHYHNVWAKSVIAKKSDKSFLLSKELDCEDKKEEFVEKIEQNPASFRACIIEAKSPDYEKKLYKKYKKNGVFNHIVEDYNVANIVVASKAKQFADSWDNLDAEKGTLFKLKETLNNVKDTRGAYSLMGNIDIESPKLWSYIRRVNSIQNASDMIKILNSSRDLYLDAADLNPVISQAPGLIRAGTSEKTIMSNVFLYDCGISAADISVSVKDSGDKEKIKAAEQAIHDCMFKYAEAASKGTIDGECAQTTKLRGETSSTASCFYEDGKKLWREKQKRAVNESSFNNLTLATINNYKSSRDYVKENGEKNIVSMQKGMKESTTARDDYSAGAQVNYYSAMQLLTVVDGEAQSLQSEIIKDLVTFDYSYFGEITDNPADKKGS